jgi:hypothetical protein
MENIQGLNELIKNRLIEKKGNVKLTENTDIILYGKALGISENQLLFKILEIEETIDWAKEKENIIKSETFTTINNVSAPNNTIYCSSCNAVNEKGIANFCVDCGKELRTAEPIKPQNNFVTPNSIKEKSKSPYIILAIALLVILILVGFGYSRIKKDVVNNGSFAVDTTEVINDTSSFKSNDAPTSLDTAKVANPSSIDSTIVEKSSYEEQIDNFIKYNENCIKDLNTNYYWYIAPDRDFDFESANSFSNNLTENGLNWRVPTYSEIKTLYNSQFSAGEGYYANNEFFPAKIHNVFNAVGTGSWFWVSDRSYNSSIAHAINLHEGIKVSVNIQNHKFPVHVLLISK